MKSKHYQTCFSSFPMHTISPGHLVHIQILMQESWGRAWDFAFLTSFQKMLTGGSKIKKGLGGIKTGAVGSGFTTPCLWLKAAVALPKGSSPPSCQSINEVSAHCWGHPDVQFTPSARGCQWGGTAVTHGGNLFNHSSSIASSPSLLPCLCFLGSRPRKLQWKSPTQGQLLGERDQVRSEVESPSRVPILFRPPPSSHPQ